MAEVITPASLRKQLRDLERQCDGHRGAGLELRRQVGETLLEVRETPGITLTEAAQLLGISKPTAYKLLEAAS
jgi:hypothetical protein